MRRLRDALWGMLLASLPLPGGALDWQPIARTGEPAPGLPGETLYEVDAGFYLGLRPLVAADGTVRFRAWPASEAPSAAGGAAAGALALAWLRRRSAAARA